MEGVGIYIFIGIIIGLISASDKGVFNWGSFTVVVLFWPVIIIGFICWVVWHGRN